MTDLPVLNFPEYNFRLRMKGARPEIFDPVRKSWVKLSPEEWVRAHCIAYFNQDVNVPLSLISVEKKLVVHGFERRYDMLIFNRRTNPVMLVECKAPSVPLGNAVLEQACVYNLKLRVEYLFLTNGLQHFCARMNFQENTYSQVEELHPELFVG